MVSYVLASGRPLNQSKRAKLLIEFAEIASKAKTQEAFFSQLRDSGLPDTPEAQKFSREVFDNAPRKSSTKKKDTIALARKQHEKELQAMQNQKFGLMLEEEAPKLSAVKKDKESKKERSSRKRDTSTREWDDDEEEQALRRRRREERDLELQKRTGQTVHGSQDRNGHHDDDEDMEEEYEDEDVRKERERKRDLKERDEFAARLKEKERENKKKIVEDRSSKTAGAAEAAARRHLGDDLAARVAAMPSLRERSRQEYLTKREIQQVELLRREIQDDENLFHGMRISTRERNELEYKKEVLRLAEERMRIDDRYDGYQLPEDYFTTQGKIDKKRKEAILYQRYEEAKENKPENFVTDVDHWEEGQTKASTFRAGALDKEEIAENFDYVFDDSQAIEFVMEATMGGEGISAKDAELKALLEQAEKRGEFLLSLALQVN
jgi:pre-mRNA-splicing factor ATP-dependent RNA helicase DHX16